jgi:hypothetical protein
VQALVKTAKLGALGKLVFFIANRFAKVRPASPWSDPTRATPAARVDLTLRVRILEDSHMRKDAPRKDALWGFFALAGTVVWLTAVPARLGAG